MGRVLRRSHAPERAAFRDETAGNLRRPVAIRSRAASGSGSGRAAARPVDQFLVDGKGLPGHVFRGEMFEHDSAALDPHGQADPGFGHNFRLRADSPAIHAGSPVGPANPDGSRKDLGAYAYDESELTAVVISEIHYHPAAGEILEFVELINTANHPTDLSGWRLTLDVEFVFPAGTSLAPGECVVVARVAGIYTGQGARAFSWTEGQLADDWGHVQLEDESGRVIDYVNYSDDHGWPTSPDGAGPSLELRDLSLENLYYANWRPSQGATLATGGTPGRPPSEPPVTGLTINEVMAINDGVIMDENGQYDDWIELYNGSDVPVDVGGLYVTDDLSNLTLYQIPTTDAQRTTIAPNGFLLLWADGNREEGIVHLDLKLSGTGEQLGLVQIIDGMPVLIDQLISRGPR